ncbi:MAG: S8 family serine peptidase [Candidatus Eisenbacteria bacterium]|nr:S8 family serine peptidase [Candidatus Eisenbacteria bacterium]
MLHIPLPARIAIAAVLITMTTAPAAFADRPVTKVESLLRLSESYRQAVLDRRTDLYARLLAAEDGPAAALNGNPNVQLIGIDPRGMPRYYTTGNLDAAITIRTAEVWPGGGGAFDLTGAGTEFGKLGIWDGGGVRLTHDELTGRVEQIDVPQYPLSSHSTHVAGTMIAAGVDPAAQGMSYEARLSAYDWLFDGAEMAAAAAGGMNVSNHSYGLITGWYYDYGESAWYWWGDNRVSDTEDYGFGFYGGGEDYEEEWLGAVEWDQIAHDAPYYTIVMAAGNDRNDDGPGPGGGHWVWDYDQEEFVWSTVTREPDGGEDGYDSIGWMVNAKNIITVGAIEDIPGGYDGPEDVVVTDFSGFGPTDDGRIKPDLVANGTGLYSSTAGSDTSYAGYSGTSMASPNLEGSVNLLVRHYEETHGGETPLSSTVKGILIQTADEAGPDEGPDYKHGWGLMNTLEAARLFEDDSEGPKRRIFEEMIADGQTHELYLHSLGEQPLCATLAWNDVPGTPPPPSLNPTTPMLVHDLDIRIEKVGGATHYPYKLDGADPSAPATSGDNTIDNIEQVHVGQPEPGTYRVSVSHKGTLSSPQAYSLILSRPAASEPMAFSVPGDFTTIQSALDIAAEGDSVIVADGVYTGDGNRDLDFRGANIVLRSVNGSAATILDCEGSQADPHRGIHLHNEEGPSAVVQGFTIRNGYALDGGGGIRSRTASPTFIDLVVEHCVSEDYGGGVSSADSSGTGDSSPTFLDCEIAENGASRGGGLQLSGAAPS